MLFRHIPNFAMCTVQILSRFDNATSLSLLDAQLFWDPDLGDLLGGLPHLQNLHLENSSRLTVLPWQISQSHMQSILVKACQQLVSLSALGLGSVKHSLRSLSIHNCSGFRTLTAWIGALDELRDLSIVRCSRFANSEASCSLSSLQQLTRYSPENALQPHSRKSVLIAFEEGF